jgi:PncC family amidohydrolase
MRFEGLNEDSNDRLLIESLITALTGRSHVLTTAESCTGGLIGALITDVPGSSAVYETGFITYSNAAKQRWLDVPAAILETDGAVSEPCAIAMAKGALFRADATVAIAVTGIAGPGGGTPAKPVGLVYVALTDDSGTVTCTRYHFDGNRQSVRRRTAMAALSMLSRWLTVHK